MSVSKTSLKLLTLVASIQILGANLIEFNTIVQNPVSWLAL